MEEKVGERIGSTGPHLETVAKFLLQMRFDRFRFIVTIARVSIHHDRIREGLYPRID